jgi:integrase
VRLLLLTCVRTCELLRARPEQFDLDRELWIIPSGNVKQLPRKKRKTGEEIPPYIVPLSAQALEIVRDLLDRMTPSQTYLLRNRKELRFSGRAGDAFCGQAPFPWMPFPSSLFPFSFDPFLFRLAPE